MTQVVYLDLRKVKIQQDACNLINVGPCACLAGQISAVLGQQGAPSTVCGLLCDSSTCSVFLCIDLSRHDMHMEDCVVISGMHL